MRGIARLALSSCLRFISFFHLPVDSDYQLRPMRIVNRAGRKSTTHHEIGRGTGKLRFVPWNSVRIERYNVRGKLTHLFFLRPNSINNLA